MRKIKRPNFDRYSPNYSLFWYILTGKQNFNHLSVLCFDVYFYFLLPLFGFFYENDFIKTLLANPQGIIVSFFLFFYFLQSHQKFENVICF